MNAAIIFCILLALMLTGMPISISLGLTVLSFIFLFTHVPLESVALKGRADLILRARMYAGMPCENSVVDSSF